MIHRPGNIPPSDRAEWPGRGGDAPCPDPPCSDTPPERSNGRLLAGRLGVIVSPDPSRMGHLAGELAARFRSDAGHAVAVVNGIAAADGLFPRLAPLSCLIVLAPKAPGADLTWPTAPCGNPWCQGLRHLKQIASFRGIVVLAICPLVPVCDHCGGKPPFQPRQRCPNPRALVADFLWRV